MACGILHGIVLGPLNTQSKGVDMSDIRSILKPVVIQDHVWIGSHTIIQRGVTIGTNSVVAAGSVVIKDIPPNSFAAGVPAKVLKEIAGWDRNPDKAHKPQEATE